MLTHPFERWALEIDAMNKTTICTLLPEDKSARDRGSESLFGKVSRNLPGPLRKA